MNDEQVVQVDYDEELVKEYSNNYIMEEEGIGSDELGPVYDEQTVYNTDSLDELLGEGAEILDEL